MGIKSSIFDIIRDISCIGFNGRNAHPPAFCRVNIQKRTGTEMEGSIPHAGLGCISRQCHISLRLAALQAIGSGNVIGEEEGERW